MSANFSIGWLEITASPFRSEFSCRMQQAAYTATVWDVIAQINGCAALKKSWNHYFYDRPTYFLRSPLNFLVLYDAGRHCERTQLADISVVLIGNIVDGSLYHVLALFWIVRNVLSVLSQLPKFLLRIRQLAMANCLLLRYRMYAAVIFHSQRLLTRETVLLRSLRRVVALIDRFELVSM